MKLMTAAAAIVIYFDIVGLVGAAHLSAKALVSETPMQKVVELLGELKARVEEDGKLEQASYDTYSCWCEDTLSRKAKDISSAKTSIDNLQTLILKLKAQIAMGEEAIKNLDGSIASNIASQRESMDMRAKRNTEYLEEKTESEQCIGALESAIKVLTGAGEGRKKGFLMTMQEAQVLGAVAGLRGLLSSRVLTGSVSSSDMEVVRRFVERPEDFLGDHGGDVNLLQVEQNPFGDYAPRSTQIQGILKSMYDTFAADLEKANAEEAEEQKSFQSLIATKKNELKTLQMNLEATTVDKAFATEKAAESAQLLDDTKSQLEADEQLFDAAKKGCQSKADEWSTRTRLRTEELQGMAKAIEILSAEESSKVFHNALTTLLQTSKTRKAVGQQNAWSHFQALATKYGSNALFEVAAMVRAGGHFDVVIAAIDQMITILRKEEQDDISHKDRCQRSTKKINNDIDDNNHNIARATVSLERMEIDARSLLSEISGLEEETKATEKDMATLLDLRNKDVAAFRQALKDDADAVALLNKAIVSLTEFYKNNNLPLELVQQAPEYSVNQDKAPETVWSGKNYQGRTAESHGIISILSMLVEDLELEMKTARSADAAAESQYEAERGSLKLTLDKQHNTKVAAETSLADLRSRMEDTHERKSTESADLNGHTAMQSALYTDCSWVDTHFGTRRDKRKTEMAALVDAKAYLAGVERGDEVP